MEIVNVRIDERMIHGQVASFWTNHLSATRIMVVNNEVIKDPVQKAALKMSCPAGIKLSLLSVNTAAKNLIAKKYAGERVFLISKTPHELLALLELGVELPEINVGNMSTKPNSVSVKKSVAVTPEDIVCFKAIEGTGTSIVAQMVPSEEKIQFMPLLVNVAV